ncbi:MAG: fasciclin domain-containing protein [Solirubrobacterales bacterium]
MFSVAVLGLTACSDGDSGNGSATDAADSGGEAKVFRAAPIEPEDAVPKGLKDASGETIVAVLQASPEFSDYVKLLQLSGVAGDLATRDSVTVFAPLNEAVSNETKWIDPYLVPENLKSVLAKLSRGFVPKLDDPERLAALLRRGIAEGEVPPDRLRAGLRLAALEGDTLRLAKSAGSLRVEGVRFDSRKGVLTSNGVLYPASGLVAP